jgi:hypothetical protein
MALRDDFSRLYFILFKTRRKYVFFVFKEVMDVDIKIMLWILGIITIVLGLLPSKYEKVFQKFFLFSTYFIFLLLILVLKNKMI